MQKKHALTGIMILAVVGILLISGCAQKNKILTNADISKKIESNQDKSCYDTQNDYPKTIGKHSLNELNLEEICFCSDYCPEELWHITIRYENVSSKERCAEIGGKDLFDAAWGGYVGCVPKIE